MVGCTHTQCRIATPPLNKVLTTNCAGLRTSADKKEWLPPQHCTWSAPIVFRGQTEHIGKLQQCHQLNDFLW